MQVEWAESAYKSLKGVIEYTEEEFGNRQVEVIAKKIADTVRTISAIPNAFPKESLLSRMKGNYHSAAYRPLVMIEKVKNGMFEEFKKYVESLITDLPKDIDTRDIQSKMDVLSIGQAITIDVRFSVTD